MNLWPAVASAAAVAAAVTALDVGLPKYGKPTISRTQWNALDHPSSSWFPVTVLTAVNVHILCRARWPASLAWGAGSGLFVFAVHRTVSSIAPRLP